VCVTSSETGSTVTSAPKEIAVACLLMLSLIGCAVEAGTPVAERVTIAPASGDFVDSLTDAREVTLEQSADTIPSSASPASTGVPTAPS
jgi:hypothetical protein